MNTLLGFLTHIGMNVAAKTPCSTTCSEIIIFAGVEKSSKYDTEKNGKTYSTKQYNAIVQTKRCACVLCVCVFNNSLRATPSPQKTRSTTFQSCTNNVYDAPLSRSMLLTLHYKPTQTKHKNTATAGPRRETSCSEIQISLPTRTLVSTPKDSSLVIRH